MRVYNVSQMEKVNRVMNLIQYYSWIIDFNKEEKKEKKITLTTLWTEFTCNIILKAWYHKCSPYDLWAIFSVLRKALLDERTIIYWLVIMIIFSSTNY